MSGCLYNKIKRYTVGTTIWIIFSALLLMVENNTSLSADDITIKESFETLDNWQPLFFENIKNHSDYTTEQNGAESFLRATSNDSASGIVHTRIFSVYETPVLSWRWKVANIYSRGNAASKEGDDYPVRIYVLFHYDPDRASTWEQITYGTYKALYGEYPPHSTLNYIWANRPHADRILPNTYTDKAQMIPLQYGDENLGRWMQEKVNILEDYRLSFGEDPPEKASLAIMNDSDNTGEQSISWVDDIILQKN